MNFIAKRFLFVDETRTETAARQKNFENFQTALAWIQGNTDCNAAGGSIMDAETWGIVYEIGRDGVPEDYRNK